MEILKKSNVKKFIRERSSITRVKNDYIAFLELKVANIILASIKNNCSRKTITAQELTGVNGKGE
jgi:hypothetical protein